MVVTGALQYKEEGMSGHDHHFVYKYFHHSSILLNHRIHWWLDGLPEFEIIQMHGIATVDTGHNYTDYSQHLSEQMLTVQANLIGVALRHHFNCFRW